MQLIINTDGGARNNPGPAAIGVVARVNNVDVFECSEYIGIATNNVAEYKAALQSVKIAREYVKENSNITEVVWRLDSKLVVEQLNKRWKIKDSNLKILALEVWTELNLLPVQYSFGYVPRAENKEADLLVNQALDASIA